MQSIRYIIEVLLLFNLSKNHRDEPKLSMFLERGGPSCSAGSVTKATILNLFSRSNGDRVFFGCKRRGLKMPENQDKHDLEHPYIHVEQTLAIIKPDAIDKTDEIEEIILRHGFSILRVSGEIV